MNEVKEEQALLVKLKQVERKADMLEGRVAALDSELDEYMEFRTSDCRAANKLWTVSRPRRLEAVRNSKKGPSKQIVRVMNVNEVKLEKPEEYRRMKKENLRLRLQDFSRKVKTAKDRELSDFMEYLLYKVAQLGYFAPWCSDCK